MIFWMRRQARDPPHARSRRRAGARRRLGVGGSSLLACVGVLREGVETALLLFGSFEGADALRSGIGAAIGLTVAAGLGYLFYRGSERLDLRRFFTFTSALLLLFAAYLLANGLQELGESGIVPENEALLATAFGAVALPTLYLFFRKPKARAAGGT
jgi:high-affinity iron transporter